MTVKNCKRFQFDNEVVILKPLTPKDRVVSVYSFSSFFLKMLSFQSD